MKINTSLYIVPIFATWIEGKVNTVLGTEPGTLVHLPFDPEYPSLEAFLDDMVKQFTIDQSRIYHEHLSVTVLRDQARANSTQLKVFAPYLVLTPPDVFSLHNESMFQKGLAFAPIQDLLKEGLSETDRTMLSKANEALVRLIGTSSACLNMLPAFFSNVEINTIHNTVLGGQVNRMTLRKRYLDTGLVKPTGERLETETRGRSPQQMTPMIDHVHVFGAMVSTDK